MEGESDPDHGVGSGVAPWAFNIIPEDCIAKVISFTTPGDAGRLSLVSKSFKSAADSNITWERFLPPDYRTRVSPSSLDWPKKLLYLHICDQPILIEEGKKSFSMDKKTGKKCYMLSPRDLTLVYSNYPLNSNWIIVPLSRFSDIPEPLDLRWLKFGGTISTQMLSEDTLYGAYLVFKYTLPTYGFENQKAVVAIGPVRGPSATRTVFLDYQDRNNMSSDTIDRGRPLNASSNSRENHSAVKERGDGWLEVELGEHYQSGDMAVELEMSLLEAQTRLWKGGVVFQGIEIRPK